MLPIITNQARLAGVALAAAFALTASANVAFAQSGHFLTGGTNAPVCTDEGTTVLCTGKVAGLGGTTFEIRLTATGTATVECLNPSGRRAPGQDTAVTAEGTSGPLATPQNGQYQFSIETVDPGPLPATPTCPNPRWTPVIVDVTFTTATLSLFEDNVLSDQVVVIVQ